MSANSKNEQGTYLGITMSPNFSRPALRLVRLPGEFGPILRCFGELSVATAEALRRELGLLLTMGHPVLIVNLAGCSAVDVDGLLAILHCYKELRRKGSRLMLVAGTSRTSHLLQFIGLDRILPVFPSEEQALQALRGGGPPEPAPASWEEARAATVARWRAFQAELDTVPAEEALRQLTSLTTLCERAEEFFQDRPTPDATRCQFCPLFYALGGKPEDVGCRSVLDPIIDAICAGDRDLARAEAGELIRILEEMAVPEEVKAA